MRGLSVGSIVSVIVVVVGTAATAAEPLPGESPSPLLLSRLAFSGLAVDAQDRLYGADCANAVVVRFDPAGPVVIAGDGTLAFSGDGGAATSAQLYCPFDMAFDARGMFIVDHGNNRVRLVAPDGSISTFAGSGPAGIDQGSWAGDGGPAIAARLQEPVGIAIDAAGDVFIADRDNQLVRRVDPTGIITTIAGTGLPGFSGDGGRGTAAQLSGPNYLTVEGSGAIYVSDEGNQRVRRIATDGTITTVAGNGVATPVGDGGPAIAAGLGDPNGMAFDAQGDLWIADYANQLIRSVDPTGIIGTVAGSGERGLPDDGATALSAPLAEPDEIAIDSRGTVYLASGGDPCIRTISTDGIMSSFWCRS